MPPTLPAFSLLERPVPTHSVGNGCIVILPAPTYTSTYIMSLGMIAGIFDDPATRSYRTLSLEAHRGSPVPESTPRRRSRSHSSDSASSAISVPLDVFLGFGFRLATRLFPGHAGSAIMRHASRATAPGPARGSPADLLSLRELRKVTTWPTCRQVLCFLWREKCFATGLWG